MRTRLVLLAAFVAVVPVASTTTTELISTTSALVPTTVVQTEPVRLYFIASGQLTYVATPLPAPAALGQIVAALQDGPPAGDLGRGLRSAVPPARVAEIKVTSNNSGVALVELPPGFFDTISLSDQRLVTAQLVLTLTDSRGIGQVQFNIAVPKPNGEVAPPGQLLARADFLSLLESSSTPTTSTLTSTTTTTSTTGG
jgi:spore germination protein GerM